jgi:UDP-N-acetylmuramoyl-tripeptide--D-alanyl-D-alanine ligase
MSLVFEEIPRLIPCSLEPSTLKGVLGSICFDSRILNPGEAFIALQTEQADGHTYIKDAFKKGAPVAIVQREWFSQNGEKHPQASFIVVEDTLKALQTLAAAHRSRFRIPVIALTGSNGKTSTKEFLAAALSLRFSVLKSPGNYNNYLGVPLTMLQMDPDTEIAVVEMGTNRPGDIERLCSIAKPDVGIVLNVGPAHLEGLGDLEGVAQEKGVLLKSLPSQGYAFVNCDDSFACAMTSSAGNRFCFGFNADVPEADCDKMICAEDLGLSKAGQGSFRLRGVEFKLSWHGKHQIYNALAAVAVGDFFGVPLNEIAAAIAKFQPLDGRLKIDKHHGITIIDDAYNANIASTSSALEFFESMKVKGRKFVVLGDHLELGEASREEHKRLGYMLADKKIDGVFLVGPEMHYAKSPVSDKLVFYWEDSGDLQPLIDQILQTVQPDDAVLVKASNGMGLDRVVRNLQRIPKNQGS